MIDPNDETDARPRPRANGKHAEPLDDRLRKLEVMLAELQEAKVSEDAVAEKVVDRLAAMEPRLIPATEAVLVDGQALVPAVQTVAPPPSGAVLHPPPSPMTRAWTIAATLHEIRMTVRMYFDHRYRVSRLTQFGVPVVALLFVLNYLFFAMWFPVPVVSPVLERVLCVVLGVVLYKLLARELARYREVLDYLSRHGFHR